ncbi:52 kDa repressor of the inhibitor of the protein kinase-like, partial [Myzus persicae]|uniref:52 kDa repressor of the inhibitor of the protein kinase-like n=1 Tax=Myzus persicae TaxID=13164 RepID=UPI000B9318AB
MDKFVVRRSSAAVSQPSPNINETNFDKNKLKRPVENASNTETVPSKIAKTTEIDQDSSPFNMDVGLFSCGNVQIDDHLRLNVNQNSSVPTSNFEYPYSVHVKNGKEGKRFLRENHFKNYPWLTYSISKEGLFCKICVLFKESNLGGKHKTENLKTLVTTPLKKFSKLLGKDGFLEVHQNNLYHKYALQRADQFKSTILNPKKNILNLVNADRLKKITENRERLKPIIQSIMFLGKQNIPLRGHRDDGALFANDNHHKMKNEGNFRELLRYRVKSGDKILEQHLLTTHSKATYINSNVQNQLIDCFKEEIQSEIIKEIKENRFYSIMFDETTDLSHVSQMSLVLRYVVNDKIKENFIEFIDCHQEAYSKLDSSENIEPKLSGEHLGQIVIDLLKKFSLELHDCIGITTDGCSVMTSKARGAVQHIQKFAKNAIYSPCANHALNLCISKSSTVQFVRNSVGIIKEVVAFLNSSSKRNFVLKSILKNHSLKTVCETRWIDRHDSILLFTSSFSDILVALSTVSEWSESESATKAKMLISALENCEFILTLFTLTNILSITLPISKCLQGKERDFISATDSIQLVLDNLTDKRTNCSQYFNKIYKEASELMKKHDVVTKHPRISKRQTQRPNPPSNSPEEYYMRS